MAQEGAGNKMTFGTKLPINIHMLNEIIKREVKHFRNYKTYKPDFGSVPVASKFYAAHDQITEESSEETEKVETYRKKVSQTRSLGPHSKYEAPVTDNQVYGWYHNHAYPLDRSDGRFYFPMRESSMTKIAVIIAKSNLKNRV